MPELPEVETVARQLAPNLRGRMVKEFLILDPKLKGLNSVALKNARITDVFRMGKKVVIAFKLTTGAERFLGVHLRMTGRLIWVAKQTEKQNWGESDTRHLRARIVFDKGELRFIDARRFGTLEIVNNLEELKPLGIEPLSRDFDSVTLSTMMLKSKQPIKVWLLRQDRIVGIGNIYASEILFDSRISPLRKTHRTKPNEAEKLVKSTIKILQKAIDSCGTTFSDFQDSRGEIGNFQTFLKVYDREGQPCKSCKSPIKRLVQAQRSTYYCSICQR